MKKYLLISLLMLSGCGYGKWSTQIASFSATAPTLDKISSVYANANEIHLMEQKALLFDRYSSNGFMPGTTKPFISDKDLKARRDALDALESYSKTLDKIANPTEKAKAIVTPAISSALTTEQKTRAQKIDLIASELNTLTMALAQHTAKKNLPIIMAQADPLIQKFAVLFVEDLNDIRRQETNDYDTLIIQQDQFIQHNLSTLSPTDQRTEIERLIQLEQESSKAQSNLDDAIQDIQSFAYAHHILSEEK